MKAPAQILVKIIQIPSTFDANLILCVHKIEILMFLYAPVMCVIVKNSVMMMFTFVLAILSSDDITP